MKIAALLTMVVGGVACVDASQYPPLNRNYVEPVCDDGGCVAHIYVDPAATGEGTGDDWANAYTDLGAALVSFAERLDYSAEPAQTPATIEIWLAGEDHGTTGAGLNLDDRGYSSLSILGGFSGDETTAADRDPSAPKAKLIRAGCEPAIYGPLDGAVVIDRLEVSGEGTCSRFFDVTRTESATVTRSLFQGLEAAVSVAGAVTVLDTSFVDNELGLEAVGATQLTGCTFNGNVTGLSVEGDVTLTQSVFISNTAGAVVSGGDVTMAGGQLDGNVTGLQVQGTATWAALTSVALHGNGVGVDTQGGAGLSGCTITDHTTVGVRTGADVLAITGAQVQGNALGLDAKAGGTVSSTAFSDNVTAIATAGGAMFVSDCSFVDDVTGIRAASSLSVIDTTIDGAATGIDASSSLSLDTVTIDGAVTGARIAGSTTVTNCTLHDTSSGIYVAGGSLRVVNSTFTDNSDGIYALGSTNLTRRTEVEGSTFTGNYRGVYHRAKVSGDNFDLLLWESTFTNNSTGASVDNGLLAGSLLFSANTSKALVGAGDAAIVSSDFLDNSGVEGVAVDWTTSGGVAIYDCRFLGNHATFGGAGTEYGGVIHQSLGDLVIGNSIFYDNTFTSSGGGTARGGAIGVEGTDLQVFNSVFWDNEADFGAAIGAIDTPGGVKASVTVHTTTIKGWWEDDFSFQHTGGTLLANSLGLTIGLGCFPACAWPTSGVTDANGLCYTHLVICPNPFPSPCNTLHACAGTGVVGKLPADVFDLDDDGNTTEPLPRDLAGNPRVNGNLDPGAWEL